MPSARGYAATAPDAPLSPYQLERREVGPCDVQIEILFCGVCHSDLHMARSDWWQTPYPLVPGHEFAGVISEVGRDVSGWQVGQRVTTPFVLGCGGCEFCRAGDAQVNLADINRAARLISLAQRVI